MPRIAPTNWKVQMEVFQLIRWCVHQQIRFFLSMWVCVGRASVASGWLIIFIFGGDEMPHHDRLDERFKYICNV